MSDLITYVEHRAIAQFLATKSVTVIPAGQIRETQYVWDGKRLVRTDGIEMSWKAQKINNAKAALGKRKSVVIAAAEKRRDEVERLAATGMTRPEIAEALGVNPETVKKDCQLRGIVTAPVIQAKRVAVLTPAIVAYATAHPEAAYAEIARATGAAPATVRRTCRRMRTGK